MASTDLIMSGDCGGTNTRLSLWNIPKETKHIKGDIAPGEMMFSKKYLNEDYASFAEVCHLFLNEAKLVNQIPEACVLACAGPILKNTVDFTNVEFGWKIDGPGLEKELGIKKVRLINDFAAMGYGLLTLRPHEYIVLNDAPKDETAPMATIGAGTGLGECFLTPGTDGQYSCFACEGKARRIWPMWDSNPRPFGPVP
ncbi:Glucokinase [Phytophthora palmivora]|uniref:Glucokinase n=1 Tax=Phytophthora palmivora TaxID=4796 RepID=A0A2P4XP42_9STRA|nr:Glucokinase [Phytophthora palmivora]